MNGFDYPYVLVPRWGHGRSRHQGLAELLGRRRGRYREVLARVLAQRTLLASISVGTPDDPEQPFFRNGFLPGLDAAVLYTMMAWCRPGRYVEVGSGNSTKFVRRAIRDHGLKTQVVSIDPTPRAEIDALCDTVVRRGLEDCDLSLFADLDHGDIVFVDSSHRCLQNSDVTAFFVEVLPSLRPGVWVQVHDILLPDDYPAEWRDRLYSEQYLLAAYLLSGCAWLEVVLPNWYVSTDPGLCSILDPLWDDDALQGVERHGQSFWFRTSSHPTPGWWRRGRRRRGT